MKFNKAKLKDLSLADLKVLTDDAQKQFPNYSPESPEYNYFTSMIDEVAAEKAERIKDLVTKEDDELTDAEKSEEEVKKDSKKDAKK